VTGTGPITHQAAVNAAIAAHIRASLPANTRRHRCYKRATLLMIRSVLMLRQLSPDGSRRLPARRLLLLSLGGLALFMGWRPPLASAQPVAPTDKTTFLVIYRPGPAWVPGKPVMAQPPKEHGTYLIGLFAKGTMKLAGPFTDDSGGAVVLEAASQAEATAIVKADPAVQKAIFRYEIHPWRLVPWEKYVKPK